MNAWAAVASVPGNLSLYRGGMAAGNNGKLYFVGGDGADSSALLEYDPADMDKDGVAWATRAPIPVQRIQEFGFVAAQNGLLYAFGGNVKATGGGQTFLGPHSQWSSGTWAYDVGANTWTPAPLALLTTGRDWPGGASLGGRVYAVGGSHLYNMIDKTEQLTPQPPATHMCVEVAAARPTVALGAPLSYTATLTHDAGAPAPVVSLVDWLPAGFAWNGAAPLVTAGTGSTCALAGSTTQSGNVLTIPLSGAVGAGSACTVKFTVAANQVGAAPNPAVIVTYRSSDSSPTLPQTTVRGAAPVQVVLDATPPVIAAPPALVVNADSPAGRVVAYAASATDDSGVVASFACSPASGTAFPVGDTVVTCTAADGVGNTATKSFTVHVAGAAEMLGSLRATIRSPGSALPGRVRLVLLAPLVGLPHQNRTVSCNRLNAFVHLVNARTQPPASRPIPPALANQLRSQAHQIRLALGC